MASYRVQIWDFDANDYSPNQMIAEFSNPKYIGYGSYLNDVGEAFWSLRQRDPKVDVRTYGGKAHVIIIRKSGGNTDVVWRGVLSEHDANDDDTILYAYTYEHYLFTLHTKWKKKWKQSKIAGAAGRPIDDLWSRAKNQDRSPMQWITDGTTEAPWVGDSQTTELTLQRYRVQWKPILVAFRELVAIATSDTDNVCYFEIDYPSDPTDKSATFNFWRDRTSQVSALRLRYPFNVFDWSDRFTPVLMRNKTYAVGSGPRNQVYRFQYGLGAGNYGKNAFGTHSQNMYLSWVRDRQELKRVTKRRQRRLLREDVDAWVRCVPGRVPPWRSTDSSWKLGDTIYVDIDHGATDIGKYMFLVGEQVVFANGREYVQPMLEDRSEGLAATHDGWTWITGDNGEWVASPSKPIGTQTQTISVTIPDNENLFTVCVVVNQKQSGDGLGCINAMRLGGQSGTKIVEVQGLLSGLGNRSVQLWAWNTGVPYGSTVDLEIDWDTWNTDLEGNIGAASTVAETPNPTLLGTDTISDSGGGGTTSVDVGVKNAVSVAYLLTTSAGNPSAGSGHEMISTEADVYSTHEGHSAGSTQTNTGVVACGISDNNPKTGVGAAWDNEA